MNKSEFIAAVAEKSDLSKNKTAEALEAVIATISKQLKKGDKIMIAGFGSFEVRKRKARTGRNPQTGEEIKIKASKVIGFKAGKAFKDAV